MIERTGAQELSAAQKAQLIYSQARNELSGKLWRAALGTNDDAARGEGSLPGMRGASGDGMTLDGLLALLQPDQAAAATAVPPMPNAQPQLAEDGNAASGDGSGAAVAMQDGPNARYGGMIDAAAARTGLPAAAVAAIVDAEAAKGTGGTWQPYSRNPRSSAAGLGQFLNGTWEGQAERSGTWLNATAQANGWLDARGQVRAESRSALLALRYDPRASIETVADYAQGNVAALRGAGVKVGEDVSEVARAAYLGHHLGLGDARRFLAGGLSDDRARRLLDAQVGSSDAGRRIARAGGAVAAHRTWLLDYVGHHVRPERFA